MTPSAKPLGQVATFLGLALVVLLPIVLIAWGFIAAAATETQNIAAARQLDAIRSRVAALKSSVEDQAGTTDAQSEVYFAGATPAMAGAAIQQRLAEMIADAGGQISESQVVPLDPAVNEPERIDLRASFDTRIAGLQQLLFDLETGTPFLIVRGLSIRALADETSDLDRDPDLRVEIVVSGYQQPAGS